MKIECPKCGIIGFLQKRGNSFRVQHYKGLVNDKRIYRYHALKSQDLKLLEVNGSKKLEVKNPKKFFIPHFQAGRVGFEPTTPTLGG